MLGIVILSAAMMLNMDENFGLKRGGGGGGLAGRTRLLPIKGGVFFIDRRLVLVSA